MRATIEDFCKALREEEFYNEEAEEWQFRDGSACAICTASAEQIAQRFGGLVLGYHSASNPTASIGLPAIDGHDFALIDDRWLVDYWAWHVAGIAAQPILDLSYAADRTAACVLYGPANVWELVDLNPVPSRRIASGAVPSNQILQGCGLSHSHRRAEPIQRSLHAPG